MSSYQLEELHMQTKQLRGYSHFLQDINQKNYKFDVQQLTHLTNLK